MADDLRSDKIIDSAPVPGVSFGSLTGTIGGTTQTDVYNINDGSRTTRSPEPFIPIYVNGTDGAYTLKVYSGSTRAIAEAKSTPCTDAGGLSLETYLISSSGTYYIDTRGGTWIAVELHCDNGAVAGYRLMFA